MFQKLNDWGCKGFKKQLKKACLVENSSFNIYCSGIKAEIKQFGHKMHLFACLFFRSHCCYFFCKQRMDCAFATLQHFWVETDILF
jgi:hypothetical protein